MKCFISILIFSVSVVVADDVYIFGAEYEYGHPYLHVSGATTNWVPGLIGIGDSGTGSIVGMVISTNEVRVPIIADRLSITNATLTGSTKDAFLEGKAVKLDSEYTIQLFTYMRWRNVCEIVVHSNGCGLVKRFVLPRAEPTAPANGASPRR